jgi:diketogulonate reductase-like aldo/keto reductase
MIHAPRFIYGTAWKTTATAALIKTAVSMGFKAIDTANQPKHYSEQLVGDALLELTQTGVVSREQLFLQTKFTPADGQDERIPYDPTADLATQVVTSFQSSLAHLKTSYIDSYLLHGPYGWPNLNDADWKVWQAIEKIYESGKAKLIGISNVNIKQLELLTSKAKIKPMVVQNRCFAHQGWDKAVREFCKNNNIMYQGFSLLTANTEMLQSKKVIATAQRLNKTPEQIIFRFAVQIGMVPLTGTRDAQHMQQDLAIGDFELSVEEMVAIENVTKSFL